MKRLGFLPVALALGACSGHQTFDDGSDELGGRRPPPNPVVDAALPPEPEPVDAGRELFEASPPTTASDVASDSTTPEAPTSVDTREIPDSVFGEDTRADASTSSEPWFNHDAAPPPETVGATLMDAGPGCYAGFNHDFSAFESAGLSCDQVYCPQEPVVMPWLVEPAMPCYTAAGNVCAAQLDEGGFFYQYQDGAFFFEIGFDQQLGQSELTDAALTANLRYMSISGMRIDETSRPGATPTLDSHLVRFDYRWEAQELFAAGYEFQDGRLIGEISGTITDAYYDVAEQSPGACTRDDIVFDCKCHFDPIDVPYTLNLDAMFVP